MPFCTLATGVGFASRQLYTNGEEHVMETKRPVVLNGIAVVATRPDLIDRVIHVDLPTIPADARRDDADTHAGWECDQPKVFAGLLDLFSAALLAPHMVQAVWDRIREARPDLSEPGVVLPMRNLAGLWQQLFPAEQCRLAQLLIERVVIADGGLEIIWRDQGWQELLDDGVVGSGSEIASAKACTTRRSTSCCA